MDENIKKLKEISENLANNKDADIFVYSGEIEKPFDERIIRECCNRKRRENVILILCTYGGSPSVAYRIARCFQQKYTKFIIWIDGQCKSAGTLLTVGAHEIVIGDYGELGPLDVQIRKKDELWESDSGLTILSAINALEEKSFELFEACFLKLKNRSGGNITLKMATELASKLAIGIMEPIIAQIDPVNLGEVDRALNIGLEYGKRLSEVSNNLKGDALNTLVNSYPAHSFVIDRQELMGLFSNIREPESQENELLELLFEFIRNPLLETVFINLLDKLKEEENENHNDKNLARGAENKGAAVSDAEQVIASEKKTGAKKSKGNNRKVIKIKQV